MADSSSPRTFPEGVFPQPKWSLDDREFWEACNRKELVIQQCGACGELRHPPTPTCPSCRSFDVEWAPVPGTGEIFTYTTTHHAVGPQYEDNVPYTIVVVRLDGTDDILFLSHLVDAHDDDIHIGTPVEVTWEHVDESTTLPLFRPRSA